MRVAIVHDYFNQNGGAEKVVESLLKLYPTADLYTSTYIPENFTKEKSGYEFVPKAYEQGRVKSTYLDKFFLNKDKTKSDRLKFFKHLFFIYPIVMSFVKIKNYDLVIISSTYCGKNIKIENCGKVIHYCHSPVRFLHGLVTETDHASLSFIQNVAISIFKPFLKWMDLKAVKYLNGLDCVWVANSIFIQKTIEKVYGVSSTCIYPPVDLGKFANVLRERDPKEDFYLCHGRISFHKRIDLAILACLETGDKLYISGVSALESETNGLKQLVPNDKKDQIIFLGRTSDEQLLELVANAKAMIFPGKEDAGIAPIEMIAGGLPVIAYGAGGALEYVQEGVNGLFFTPQNVDPLVLAMSNFKKLELDTKKIKTSVNEFSEQVFMSKISFISSIK
jgi:glycosyltransferase involved in cell wall biosynthesis